MIISDPSIKGVSGIFKKAAKNEIWKLSVVDGRLASSLKYTQNIMKRKLEGVMAKNKELETNLDQAIKQHLHTKEPLERLRSFE